MALVQLCQKRHWHYLLRVSKEHTFHPEGGQEARQWRAFADLVGRSGQSWFGPALGWQEHHLSAFVSAVWEPGHREAWFLISDQPADRARVQAYRRRMRIESSFQDFKRRGWDIEGTMIAERARLDRLLLGLFLAA